MAMNKISPYWEMAQRVAEKRGFVPEWLYAQWALESANFTSRLTVEDNNLGGIEYCGFDGEPAATGDTRWQHFSSLEQFERYMNNHFAKTDGVEKCKTAEEYAQCLKDNGYYTEPVNEYLDLLNSKLSGDSPINPSAAGYTSGSATSATERMRQSNSDPIGILKFANFVGSLAFKEALTSGFESSVESSLYDFLAKFMGKFYHNMYFVPTLPNNECIVVKPETMFIDVPSCNFIYPSFRTAGSFNMAPKYEPTRILLISDPVAKLMGSGGANGDMYNLLTLAFVEYDDPKTKNKLTVKGVSNIDGGLSDPSKPVGLLSAYENDLGIRILRTSKGADLYLFLLSEEGSATDSKTKQKGMVIRADRDKAKIGDVLYRLAHYDLLRARYEMRQGSYEMYFNPYILPGFPICNLETAFESNLNVTAYCVNVAHNITHEGWTTSITTTATHTPPDPKPNHFPIVEDEWVSWIGKTMDHMVGPAVKMSPYESAVDEARVRYCEGNQTATEGYKAVWRPLTTMAEHLADVCDGAEVSATDKGLLRFTGTFFDTTVQDLVLGYSSDVMTGRGFWEADVR